MYHANEVKRGHLMRIRLLIINVILVVLLGGGTSAGQTLAQIVEPEPPAINKLASGEIKRAAFLSASLPDLVIAGISWSPQNPVIGDEVTFTVSVKNQGTAEASSSRVAYYIDDAYLASDLVGSLAPGDLASVTFTWTALAGTHLIRAVADSEGEVAESDETNNEQTVTLSTLAPDLVIASITWSPENPSKGDTVTFKVSLKNQGSYMVSSSRVHFYIDGFSRGYQDVVKLAAGATANLTFVWTALPGTHRIKAIADKDNWVAESDETNNEKEVTFLTLAPDLVIAAITWSPEAPQESDNLTFTVSVKNQGSGRADSSYVVCYIDDSYLASASVNATDPGGTANLTFNWIAQPGAHTFRAIADAYRKVIESDETNNELAVTFSTLAPDLVISGITWSPQSPSIGDEVTFTVSVKNQGSGRAMPSRVHFYIDGALIGYQDIQEVEASATATATFTWTARAETHIVKAVADSGGVVGEEDETNNVTTITFADISLADLVISGITWVPESPSIGDEVIFTVSVKNQGSGRADYSYTALYLDDTRLDSIYISPLTSNTTASVTFTWTALAGTHLIRAVANASKRVIESDETNNELTLTLSTLAPDLVIREIAGVPSEPKVGEEVIFTVSIKNQGDDEALPSRVYFYIDDYPQGYLDVPELAAGAMTTRTFSWVAQSGLHTIRAVIDPDDEVIEDDETNNELTVVFPIPDLTVEGIIPSDFEPTLGEMVTLTVIIRNQGTSKAGSTHLICYVDDAPLAEASIGELEPGMAASIPFSWVAQPGAHTFRAKVDPGDEIAEAEEGNNEQTYALSTLAPDLVITGITWSPESPQEGDGVTFTVSVKNQGDGTVRNPHITGYIDGIELAVASIDELASNTTANVTFTWTALAGTHLIRAVADPNNVIAEADEGNNEQTLDLSVASPPAPPPATPAANTSAPGQKPAAGVPEIPITIPPSEGKLGVELLLLIVGIVLLGTFVIMLLRSRQ
jgi:subtilase family serine protease